MAKYDDIMTAIIQKQMKVIGGEKALKYARNIPKVVISDDGRVSTGADLETLSALVAEYKKIAGSVAIMLMRTSIAPLIKDFKLALPQELR